MYLQHGQEVCKRSHSGVVLGRQHGMYGPQHLPRHTQMPMHHQIEKQTVQQPQYITPARHNRTAYMHTLL